MKDQEVTTESNVHPCNMRFRSDLVPYTVIVVIEVRQNDEKSLVFLFVNCCASYTSSIFHVTVLRWCITTKKVAQLSFCMTCSVFGGLDKNQMHIGRGVTRLDGARRKKQVWRPHVRTWGFSEATVFKKVLVTLLVRFGPLRGHSASPRSDSAPVELCPFAPFVTPLHMGLLTSHQHSFIIGKYSYVLR